MKTNIKAEHAMKLEAASHKLYEKPYGELTHLQRVEAAEEALTIELTQMHKGLAAIGKAVDRLKENEAKLEAEVERLRDLTITDKHSRAQVEKLQKELDGYTEYAETGLRGMSTAIKEHLDFSLSMHHKFRKLLNHVIRLMMAFDEEGVFPGIFAYTLKHEVKLKEMEDAAEGDDQKQYVKKFYN